MTTVLHIQGSQKEDRARKWASETCPANTTTENFKMKHAKQNLECAESKAKSGREKQRLKADGSKGRGSEG